MERIWLESYPPDVPHHVESEISGSIPDMFEQSVAKFAARTAFVNMGASLSYSELGRLADDFGAYLRQVLGLKQGARVALALPNLLQYPIALFGTLTAGCAVVNCNPMYTGHELAFQLADSGAEVAIGLDIRTSEIAEALAATRTRHVIMTGPGDMLGWPRRTVVNFAARHMSRSTVAKKIPGSVSFRSALRQGAAARRGEGRPVVRGVAAEDLALLQYTGGTTGRPKAAMLSHRNVVSNVKQIDAWMSPLLEKGRETVITALPLYHIFALTVNCLFFVEMGATNVLITDPRKVRGLLKELRRHPFSVITGVNTLFNALVSQPDFAKLDFSAARICVAGGMSLQKAVAEKWKRATGKPLLEGYGLSEASPVVSMNPTNMAEYNGSVGLPLPSTEISIRDDSGAELPVDTAGELCVRGPQVMKGYWNAPRETALVFTPDGFLRTGDVAAIDPAGFLRVVDRKKDMIKVSGFNVSPNEIEDVVALHEGVLEVGAIGVPDAESGEAVKIVVVRRRPDLTADQLIEHCRKYLTGYKIPRQVEFRKELPKTVIGKILRRGLRTEQSPA